MEETYRGGRQSRGKAYSLRRTRKNIGEGEGIAPGGEKRARSGKEELEKPSLLT